MIFKAIRLNEITQVKCVKTTEEAPTLSPDHRPTFEGQGDKEKPAKESRVASKVKRKAGESGVPGNKKVLQEGRYYHLHQVLPQVQYGNMTAADWTT